MSVVQTLFMQEPGDASAISINDVNQGWLGDCYVCAPIAALALERPDYIRNMVRDNGDGTQSVRLYLDPFHSDISTWITVHDSDLGQGMNTNNGGQLIVNGVQEIWPQVIENALAQVNGGYSALGNGGFANAIMQQLTGSPATVTLFSFWGVATNLPTTTQLQADLAAKDMVTFFDYASNGYGLVDNHYYTLTSVDTENGVDYAHFRNPWGYADPQPIPVSDLGNAFSGMNVGTVPRSSAGLASTPLTPTIKTITGIPYTGVRLAGTSEAGSTVTVTDTVGGQTKVLGTATVSSNGTWSLMSASGLGHIDLSTVHDYSVSASDASGNTGTMTGGLFLTDTRQDVFTATPGVSDIFGYHVGSRLGPDQRVPGRVGRRPGARRDRLQRKGIEFVQPGPRVDVGFELDRDHHCERENGDLDWGRTLGAVRGGLPLLLTTPRPDPLTKVMRASTWICSPDRKAPTAEIRRAAMAVRGPLAPWQNNGIPACTFNPRLADARCHYRVSPSPVRLISLLRP